MATLSPSVARPPGDGEAPDEAGTSSAHDAPARRRGRWLVLALTAVLVAPLVIAAVALRGPPWVPVLDLAMTELRVRDVFGWHTPLVGLPGRIGVPPQIGSHPGPLSFYLLAPAYRLFGSSSWALQVATVIVHGGAVLTSLTIARRRGGTALLAAVAAVLAVLIAGYGAGALTEPWNPYLPVLWWVAFLLAAWGVADGDLPLLPVAVAAGSFCAQTHVPYVALTLGVGGAASLLLIRHWVRARTGERPMPKATWRWFAVAGAVGVVLWAPPLVDQVRHTPGNFRVLIDHFTDPPEAPAGTSVGVRLTLQRLDPAQVVRQVTRPGVLVGAGGATGYASSVRGGTVLAVWLATVALAWRLQLRRQLRLHAVLAVAIALSVFSISRIFGTVWYYLMLWAYGVAGLVVIATGWTAGAVVARRLERGTAARWGRAGIAALLAVAVGVSARSTLAAPDVEQSDHELSVVLARLVPPLVDALESGAGPATGHDGRYIVLWSDALHIGSQGYGIVNELDRRGYDAGVAPLFGVPGTLHRVEDGVSATAQVRLATGAFVDRWRDVPDAVEVASFDPRTPAEREEFEAHRAHVVAELRRLDLDDVIVEVDENLFGAAIDLRVPDALKREMGRMLDIGATTAIFLAPPGADVAPLSAP